MLAAPCVKPHSGVINLWSIFAVFAIQDINCFGTVFVSDANTMAIFDAKYSYNWRFPVVAGLAFEVTACDAVLELLQTASGFLSALAGTARTGDCFTGGGLGCLCGGFHLLESLVPGRIHSLRGGGLLVTDGFQCVFFGGDGVRKSLPGLFGRCPGLLCCRLCLGLGLLCGGGIGVHGIHQLLPCRRARFRLCAILCAGVGADTIPQVCTSDGLCAVTAFKGDASAPGLCGHAGGHVHIAVHHQRG